MIILLYSLLSVAICLICLNILCRKHAVMRWSMNWSLEREWCYYLNCASIVWDWHHEDVKKLEDPYFGLSRKSERKGVRVFGKMVRKRKEVGENAKTINVTKLKRTSTKRKKYTYYISETFSSHLTLLSYKLTITTARRQSSWACQWSQKAGPSYCRKYINNY